MHVKGTLEFGGQVIFESSPNGHVTDNDMNPHMDCVIHELGELRARSMDFINEMLQTTGGSQQNNMNEDAEVIEAEDGEEEEIATTMLTTTPSTPSVLGKRSRA